MSQRSQSIEFVVKPRENLTLEGSIRTLPRVTKGEQYPCQMQKTQSFSCLFRHYAKHNGLRKEDLVFFFVDELLPDETPETVHLMPYDEIWVEHRKPTSKKSSYSPPQSVITKQFEILLEDGEHADITFLVGPTKEEIKAHKAILSARSEYFGAMFRTGSMVESSCKVVEISHPYSIFKRMLEFLYTEAVKDLSTCNSTEVIQLLMLANEYLLEDLKRLCELSAAITLTNDSVGKMIAFSDKFRAPDLREACLDYVLKNISTLRQHAGFRQEVSDSPEVALLLVDVLPEHGCKRQRLSAAEEPQNEVSQVAELPNNDTTAVYHGDNHPQSNTIWPNSVTDSDIMW
mmetsp:Transcript_38638/g.39333  ORF Transcript_38638/g.39333 Transcript_38638/m.39333 type:complete len:345 (-) Transcript_38638:315-1349(-)|eukprot:CAMPEP_0182429166 /NCGR_PEP_ID=MMETSP1167-20130531/25564_1 /TAXON_ID=2988 /ORGANISM="Mallomonas Sp, Strain CCMP3275" /LENGTH=344 /DNA_ID=CAMNT_0024612529 /DNA_START=55 /DNA_END=1086 /DNA_ORIENTATION=-